MKLFQKIFGEKNSELRNWTKERLETFIFNETAVEHLHRYAFAEEFVKDKVVLDIASGEGYGGNLLAKKASQVIGVDLDSTAIAKASRKYDMHNLKFIQGDVANIPVESNSIDVCVSFETLEHTTEHKKMMEEVKRVIKKDGLLIMSSPDKYYYSDAINYENPHHVKELYEEEFKSLIAEHFEFSRYYYQRYLKGSLIVSENSRRLTKTFSGNYEDINLLEKVWGRFLIVVASNSDRLKLDTNHSVFDSYGMVKD